MMQFKGGGLTKDKVEGYLNDWGAVVFSFGPNEVVFDFSIYLLTTSNNFWTKGKLDPVNIIWNEISYNETTGIHRISADYSALTNNPSFIERRINKRLEDGVIVSHVNQVLTFEISRTSILQLFKAELKKDVRQRFKVKQKRWRLSNAAVNNIISQGGIVENDFSVVQTYLRDKLVVD